MTQKESRAHGTYILFISIHGLIRATDLELGRDADTGGQTKYVVDLARTLSEHTDVERVDLVTRKVADANISEDYARPVEPLSENAQIVRIEAGPEEYIPKEELWDYLDIFMDNLLDWVNQQDRPPDIIHCHYADAGYVGVRLSNLLGIPLIFTGHSLGRDKRLRLLSMGLSLEDINQRYHIDRRITAEEEALANATLVVASTHNEIEEQYGLYNYYKPESMTVIPPGTDLERFYPPRDSKPIEVFQDEFDRFFSDQSKPIILALSRPDERKNILTLVEAFGENKQLQDKANLLIVAGNRDDIREMDSGPQSVLTEILLLVDYYDLYGSVAIPKHHLSEEVPDIYRRVTQSGGVFINPALTEPFGLTLLEAAASGLPIVATENGGPVDIIGNCNNGLLIDPLDSQGIADALLGLLTDRKAWQGFSQNGLARVREFYSWQAHVESYIARIKPLLHECEPIPRVDIDSLSLRYRDRAVFSDLDQSLLGDQEALKRFVEVIRENRRCALFGIATGRRIDSALAAIKRAGIPPPDILISSLGTQINYTSKLELDDFWTEHIDYLWKPQTIRSVLAQVPGLTPQPKLEQSRFKIAYNYDEALAPSVEEIECLLRSHELTANVVHAFGQYLDVIPVRASKGQALRYVLQRMNISMEHTLVAGGSGADEDMMRGNTLAVVVANRHHEELSMLVEQEGIYFAGQSHASGILEAIDHYNFFGSCDIAEPTSFKGGAETVINHQAK